MGRLSASLVGMVALLGGLASSASEVGPVDASPTGHNLDAAKGG